MTKQELDTFHNMLKNLLSQEVDAIMAKAETLTDTPGNIVLILCEKKNIKTVDFIVNLAKVWCGNILEEHFQNIPDPDLDTE